MSVVDDFPFPWSDRIAQELLLKLTRLHPTPSRATMLAEGAGVDTAFLNSEQAPIQVWHDILDLAAQDGLTRKLVELTTSRMRPEHPDRSFFVDLLNDRRPALDPEPRNADGSALFMSGDDSIDEKEALLFHDDLTIEVGRTPALISTLEALAARYSAVCKVESTFPGRSVESGTGFRISRDRILTNWHVLHNSRGDGSVAVRVLLEFGFEDDGHGGGLSSKGMPGDVASVISDRLDDWAVIRPTVPLGDSIGIVDLRDHAEPVIGEPAYIIQHPRGGRKRLGFVRNAVSDWNERVVHYLTDTEQGSSGSPVFNSAAMLIGLHHAGGLPQAAIGRSPIIKNEAIRISRVVEGLRRNRLALY